MSTKQTSTKKRLRDAIPHLENDGSKEVALSYLSTLEEAEQMESLLQNKTFSLVIGKMKMDMRSRLSDVVKNDPELNAMKRMLARTIGLRGAEAQIEQVIDEFLDSPDLG